MIEQLFGSKTRYRLLELFFQDSQKPMYMREIARLLDTQLNAVRRELENLADMGLVKEVKINNDDKPPSFGRQKYYMIQSDHLLFFELKSLLLKSQILKEREMVEKLKEKGGDLKLLILTGDFTDAKDAPTDILMVGEIKPVSLNKVIKEFEEKVRRPIRYTVMSEKEFRERKHIGDKFLYSIFESKHLPVLDELK